MTLTERENNATEESFINTDEFLPKMEGKKGIEQQYTRDKLIKNESSVSLERQVDENITDDLAEELNKNQSEPINSDTKSLCGQESTLTKVVNLGKFTVRRYSKAYYRRGSDFPIEQNDEDVSSKSEKNENSEIGDQAVRFDLSAQTVQQEQQPRSQQENQQRVRKIGQILQQQNTFFEVNRDNSSHNRSKQNRKAVLNSERRLSHSLPSSPAMSSRLLHRTKENNSRADFFPRPPDSPKSNRRHSRNNSLNKPIKFGDNNKSEEISVLNLSTSRKRSTDDFLLKYALQQVSSFEQKDALPSVNSPTLNKNTRQPLPTLTIGQQQNTCGQYLSYSLPNSPPQSPTIDETTVARLPKQYLANRRRTVAFDKGIQLRKTFQEWLETKTDEKRRQSLNLHHVKEIERIREEQLRRERFEKTKSFDEWKNEKEEILRQQFAEAKQKQTENAEQLIQKEKQMDEQRTKKYNEWLVKKFEAELAEEERKIQELRKYKNKEF